ncbi:MAG TPA: hypothetical protein VMT70_14790 [Vicinamibacteria bacterium]|nr:hypothetical protein [Vicinamibacteria bacterium]
MRSIPLSEVVAWRGIVIHPMATPHAGVEDYSSLLEWQGLRLFLAGDTDDAAVLLGIQKLDAAYVTPSLLLALQRKAGAVDTGLLISYHHEACDPMPNFRGRLVPKLGERLRIAQE